jgi:hypothetical protein
MMKIIVMIILMMVLQRMQGFHDELDGYRKQKAEEDSLELADGFFYTNKTILKAAYMRYCI